MNPMDALMDCHARFGLPSIGEMPGKRWAGRCGPWRWLVNANRHPIETDRGDEVPPFSTFIRYNGWPAGILGPTGDGEFAGGTGANVETFAAALAAWDGQPR